MSFQVDKQTLNDLNLLGKFKHQSIFSLFNKTKTRGGEKLLDQMFREPMTDVAAINKRSELFRYFQSKKLELKYQQDSFQVVEDYLSSVTAGNRVAAGAGMIRRKMMASLARDVEYQTLQADLLTTINALAHLREILSLLPDLELVSQAGTILGHERFAWLSSEKHEKKLSLKKAMHYDWLLRHSMRDDMEILLTSIYDLDVFIAVSDVARQNDFSYAEALPGNEALIQASAIRHPALRKGVANPLELDQETNMLFLTGANMAGKSTFMKSFGIAIYLAHMGFPVAAGDMTFSVLDGLYTSINVPDNIELGYSHFYAEVLRVKQAATAVASGKNMVVIFDELFKGTNVKDAYDATLAVTSALADYTNCFFIVSTHIIEVGEVLRRDHRNLLFAYLPTVMEGAVPTYPYRFAEGITNDRHGMIIIENEKIVNIINSEKA